MPSPSPKSESRVQYERVAYWAAALVLTSALLLLCIRWASETLRAPAATSESLRASPAVLLSLRELSRLEVLELHLEKVIDLTQKQSRFLGMLEAADAILLVAAGDVTLGVDLSKLGDQDLSFDPDAGSARLVLPAPEIFSSRLDEKHTYVYTRTTDLLARRDEQLETRARQAALDAIVRAAEATDARERAKAQAERTLRALLSRTGAAQVTVVWR